LKIRLRRITKNAFMKYLITAITAVVLVGCGEKEMFLQKQSSLPNTEPLLQRQITDKELKAIADLHLAVEKGDLSKVRQCLESGTNIECVRGKASFRVLHRAAEAGNKSMVRFLIQKKANVNAMAIQGWTPLDLAQKKEQFEVVQLLRENGAKTGEELKAAGN
jgi:ankyrin repeat protein